jgi:hypothetical protein
MKEDYARFHRLTYDRFRQMAHDPSLSPREKVGFPESYRDGAEGKILADVVNKLSNLNLKNKIVMDIGPGCSDLPVSLLRFCASQGHTTLLVDSAEMLSLLPDAPGTIKVPGRFPDDCAAQLQSYKGRVDAILTYSVLQYVFAESNIFDFIDSAITLLADGGEFLIGDIPNVSKRKRFFSSPAGVACHRTFTGTDDLPELVFNRLEVGDIDDAVVAGILMRYRAAGFDTYVMPQAAGLPMATRREDILIRRP